MNAVVPGERTSYAWNAVVASTWTSYARTRQGAAAVATKAPSTSTARTAAHIDVQPPVCQAFYYSPPLSRLPASRIVVVALWNAASSRGRRIERTPEDARRAKREPQIDVWRISWRPGALFGSPVSKAVIREVLSDA